MSHNYPDPDDETEEERRESDLRRHEDYIQSLKKKAVESKVERDHQVSLLPYPFQSRIFRLRSEDPEFELMSEAYELFCCRQAVIIAETLKTAEVIEEFHRASYERQKEMVPELDDGHSGNTLGGATMLAYNFITGVSI